jgi:hypothetical protein
MLLLLLIRLHIVFRAVVIDSAVALACSCPSCHSILLHATVIDCIATDDEDEDGEYVVVAANDAAAPGNDASLWLLMHVALAIAN